MRSAQYCFFLAHTLLALVGVSAVAAETRNAIDKLVLFEPPRSAALTPVYQSLSDARSFEVHLSRLRDRLSLRSELPIVFRECGEPGAAFLPKEGKVIICYEFVDELSKKIRATISEPPGPRSLQAWSRRLSSVLLFVMFHEIAHAYIHHRSTPIFGGEEDGADNFAVVFLLEGGAEGRETVLEAIDYFDALAANTAAAATSIATLPMNEIHSLDAQRMNALVCLAGGSNAALFDTLASKKKIPPARRPLCEREFQKVKTSWLTLTGLGR